MKKVIKSVIRLSEIPKKLQKNEIFNGHKIHTYAEFHIDNSEKDELSNWLISNYPTIKRKTSFLIHIDKDVNNTENNLLIALQKIATGEIVGESKNYKDSLYIVRNIAKEAIEFHLKDEHSN